MKIIKSHIQSLWVLTFFVMLSSCSDDDSSSTVNLGISPASNADAGSLYTISNQTDILISYSSLPSPTNTGDLRDAITYIDANGDGITDVFMATGQLLSEGEVDCILAINDGQGNFTSSTAEFGGDMPPPHMQENLLQVISMAMG